MMPFSGSYFYGVDPATLYAAQNLQLQQQQQQQQLYYQPSYILAAAPTDDASMHSAMHAMYAMNAMNGAGYGFPALVPAAGGAAGSANGNGGAGTRAHAGRKASKSDAAATSATPTKPQVPFHLDVNALSVPASTGTGTDTASDGHSNGVSTPSMALQQQAQMLALQNSYLAAAAAMGLASPLPLFSPAVSTPSMAATPFFAGTNCASTGGLSNMNSATKHRAHSAASSPKKAARKGVAGGSGSGSGGSSKPASPKAGAKRQQQQLASAPPTPSALPEAKTFAEDPVEIDVTRRQLIVNYLPQKLSNEDFKALFRRFGELEEERSHIVFDFRTAGGVNAELLAWYWRRNSGDSAAVKGDSDGKEDSAATGIDEAQRDLVFAELMKSVDFAKVERQMRSKGYGFIYYKNGESTEAAIKELNGYEVNGRKIKVRYADQQRGGASAATNAATPTATASVNGNGGRSGSDDDERFVSPVSPVSASGAPALFLEGAEPQHITASTAIKVNTVPVGVSTSAGDGRSNNAEQDADGAPSERSIISSVYDMLGVDAE